MLIPSSHYSRSLPPLHSLAGVSPSRPSAPLSYDRMDETGFKDRRSNEEEEEDDDEEGENGKKSARRERLKAEVGGGNEIGEGEDAAMEEEKESGEWQEREEQQQGRKEVNDWTYVHIANLRLQVSDLKRLGGYKGGTAGRDGGCMQCQRALPRD